MNYDEDDYEDAQYRYIKVTGLLPLYLYEQHWQVARRKLQPLYGYMFTGDVMGYSGE